MKKKELKQLAQKIAKAEIIVQTSEDKKAVAQAKNQIIELSGSITSMQDIDLLDEMVQEILNKT